MYDILQLNDMLVPELKELAEKLGLQKYKRLNKQDLIYKILDAQAIQSDSTEAPLENASDDRNTRTPRILENRETQAKSDKSQNKQAHRDSGRSKGESNRSGTNRPGT